MLNALFCNGCLRFTCIVIIANPRRACVAPHRRSYDAGVAVANLLAPLTMNALALYGLGVNIKQFWALPFTRRTIERETTSFKVACLKVWP